MDKLENIRVAVRCRPLGNHEKAKSRFEIVKIDPNGQEVSISNPKKQDEPTRAYTYDSVYGPDSK